TPTGRSTADITSSVLVEITGILPRAGSGNLKMPGRPFSSAGSSTISRRRSKPGVDKPRRRCHMTQESVWTPINIRWDFLSNVYAQVPGDPDVIARWLAAVNPRDRRPGGKPTEM